MTKIPVSETRRLQRHDFPLIFRKFKDGTTSIEISEETAEYLGIDYSWERLPGKNNIAVHISDCTGPFTKEKLNVL